LGRGDNGQLQRKHGDDERQTHGNDASHAGFVVRLIVVFPASSLPRRVRIQCLVDRVSQYSSSRLTKRTVLKRKLWAVRAIVGLVDLPQIKLLSTV
jgi:hypothetical protein